MITGLADVNHWGQWFISDQTWKHIEPDAIRLCQEFTDAYFAPALEQDGIDPESAFIWFDPTPVIIRPDRSRDAKDLHDRWALSDAALRTSAFFTEHDAPSEEEIQARVLIQQAIKVRETAPITSIPTVTQSGDVTPAPPNDGGGPSQSQAASAQQVSALAWLNGGLDVALMRCYDRAGSKLRRFCKDDPAVVNVPDYELAATLGRDKVIALTGKPDPGPWLVEKGCDSLIAALAKNGAGELAATMIAQTVEAEAARRLWTVSEHADPVTH